MPQLLLVSFTPRVPPGRGLPGCGCQAALGCPLGPRSCPRSPAQGRAGSSALAKGDVSAVNHSRLFYSTSYVGDLCLPYTCSSVFVSHIAPVAIWRKL